MKFRLPLLLVLFLIAGCFGGAGVPPAAVKYYALEYRSPRFENKASVDMVIRIERFTMSQDYESREMVYRPRPFVREVYRYHRWNVPPVEMVQGLVLRDIRQAGLFRAVLSAEDTGEARYVITGRIDEFLEIDEMSRSLATFAINLSLIDASSNHGGKILLQKTYRLSEPFSRHKPDEFAQAMSTAMEKFSGLFIGDIYSAIISNKDKAIGEYR
ncbi:MAG: ABC-type transport auxiliary lipoprotein family protein [Syntrophales bacterium]|nr:ABC-type transport auxiliary lipoprotein family protein [Syntrophales bacterium]